MNRSDYAQASGVWSQDFAYDRYGNLLTRSVTQGSAPALSVAVNSKNRITNAGFTYDAAGNMTADGSGSFAYDAENRMTSAAGVSYTYDGDGRRVKKSNGKLYWYSVSGEVLQETNLGGNLLDEYIFFNGQRMARRDPSGSVFYYFEDHLGSARVVADASGTVVEDSDFYPFGGERVVVSNLDNNYKFTGQERDAESGLDYFIARHYASSLARFLQVDPGGLTAVHGQNPQTWNWYAYTLNNPLRYTDPTGMYIVSCAEGNQRCLDEADRFEERRQRNLQSDDANVRAAARAFGARGDANGVTVMFDENQATPGITSHAFTIDENLNVVPQLTVSVRSGLSADNLQEVVGHEGQHVADSLAFLGTLSIDPNSLSVSYDVNLNLTRYDAEFRAFRVSATIIQGQRRSVFLGNCRSCTITPRSSSGSIRRTINRFLRDPANRYGVTLENPGPRLYPLLTGAN